MTQSVARVVGGWAAVLSLCLAGCAGPHHQLRSDDDPYFGGTGLAGQKLPPETPAPAADHAAADRAAATLDGPIPPPPEGERSPAALASLSAPRPTTKPAKPAVAPAGYSTNGTETYEQLQQKLQDRGVKWQRLTYSQARNEWVFECGVPVSGQNGMERMHEGRAMGTHGLEAIRAALADIDQDGH